jgi:hypothetical protein
MLVLGTSHHLTAAIHTGFSIRTAGEAKTHHVPKLGIHISIKNKVVHFPNG